MRYLYASLFLILLGGFGCAKHPAPLPPPPPPVEQDDNGMDWDFDDLETESPNPKEHVWNMETKPPHGPLYFDFDGYALKDTATAGALALYLTSHPKVKVRLEGYCSEEGADDYNLALGAMRAKTVRDYLDAAGVDPKRIEWVSFGEENPVTHDPDQFHLNRRVEYTLSQP